MSAPNGSVALSEVQGYADTILLLEERLAELELAQDELGWRRVGGDNEREFSRDGLKAITKRARYAYLSNPLINHAVDVQAHYVFGQGVTVAATHPLVNDVVQTFMDDPSNAAELTSQEALMAKEVSLATDANLFLVLFPNRQTGHLKVRSLLFDEVEDIITNPDDMREPWFYKRVWMVQRDGVTDERHEAYYPDWRYQPANKPTTYRDKPVLWDSPVMHRKVGGFGHMRFGVSELFSVLDWALAVREDLEDWATIRKAHSRFATQLTTPKRSGVAAAKARLGTTVGVTHETNPPPVAGSTFISTPDVTYRPIPLANISPNPEEGRRLGLMVAAGTGIPETILFGNAEVGNLATAKTLDRPTELKMRARQMFWRSLLLDLVNYAIDWAAKAPKGKLKGQEVLDDEGRRTVVLSPDPDAEPDPRNPDAFDPNEPMDRSVSITYPELLERDVKALVDATVAVIPHLGDTDDARRLAAKLLLEALGVDDIDEVLDALFPVEELDAEDAPDAPEPPLRPDTEETFLASIRDLREAIVALGEGRT